MPLGAELARLACVLGRVGVGAHVESAQLVGPREHGAEVLAHLGLDERDVVGGDRARGSVDGHDVALANHGAAVEPHLVRVHVDLQVARAGDRGHADAARHERGVAGLPSLGGQYADGGVEAGDVVGLGGWPCQDDVASCGGGGDGIAGQEDDLALGGARRGSDACGQHVVARSRVEGRMQQRVEMLGVDRRDRLRFVEQPLVDGVHGEAHRGLAGRFALRVWSMYSLPSSTVNSVSCMSP